MGLFHNCPPTTAVQSSHRRPGNNQAGPDLAQGHSLQSPVLERLKFHASAHLDEGSELHYAWDERGLTQGINIRASLGWQNHGGPAEGTQDHSTETLSQPRPWDPSRKKINISQEDKFKKNDLNIYFLKPLNLFSKNELHYGLFWEPHTSYTTV